MSQALKEELIGILKNKSIRTMFQPIVDLKDGHILGYEALSRGPERTHFESPVSILQAAEKYRRLWDVELLCRSMALENAKQLPKGKLLFLNVNPEIIKDRKFKKGTTKDYIAQFDMDPSHIIFEITERTAISDYESFRNTIENYISQGYKIAIDDIGAGYSGLRMLAETSPQFIKIDMALVRNIDQDPLKQALMKTFHYFAEMTSMKLIAEGIESLGELNCLIDIGVHYGQGFFLQKPAFEFTTITDELRNMIKNRYQAEEKEVAHAQ